MLYSYYYSYDMNSSSDASLYLGHQPLWKAEACRMNSFFATNTNFSSVISDKNIFLSYHNIFIGEACSGSLIVFVSHTINIFIGIFDCIRKPFKIEFAPCVSHTFGSTQKNDSIDWRSSFKQIPSRIILEFSTGCLLFCFAKLVTSFLPAGDFLSGFASMFVEI